MAPSTKRFHFANGQTHQCLWQVTQQLSFGPLAGATLNSHVLDQPGNHTALLLSVDDLVSL
eukprot:10035567-Lingulodinium_polyedra.AAC.1